MKIIEEEDNSIDILIKDKENNILSLFYFTASWCGPCKKIYPSLLTLEEELKKQYELDSDSKLKKIIFYKIDIDKNENCVDIFNVEKVPTFNLYDGEKLLDSTTGCDIKKIGKLIKNNIN